jgi:hypothetical protein
VRSNLFENFGLKWVDAQRARNAYFPRHHDRLWWGGGQTRIWYATTNFDPALEADIQLDDSFKFIDAFVTAFGAGLSLRNWGRSSHLDWRLFTANDSESAGIARSLPEPETSNLLAAQRH